MGKNCFEDAFPWQLKVKCPMKKIKIETFIRIQVSFEIFICFLNKFNQLTGVNGNKKDKTTYKFIVSSSVFVTKVYLLYPNVGASGL